MARPTDAARAEAARTEKKKQKISVTYTLKSFSENIKKLKELELLDEETTKILEEVHAKVVNNWTKKFLGI